MLDRVGLDGLGSRYPHQLSGGQQQRVALARALAVEPRLILLDEPFAALDASLRASLRADVQAILSRAGTTAMLVTHDQDEALSVADLVAVLRDGWIAQCAPPEDLYARQADAGLASSVGDAACSRALAGGGVETMLGPCRWTPATTVGTAGRVTVLAAEQIDLGPNESGLTARVISYRYDGHDAVLYVQPGSTRKPGRSPADGADHWWPAGPFGPGVNAFAAGPGLRVAS